MSAELGAGWIHGLEDGDHLDVLLWLDQTLVPHGRKYSRRVRRDDQGVVWIESLDMDDDGDPALCECGTDVSTTELQAATEPPHAVTAELDRRETMRANRTIRGRDA